MRHKSMVGLLALAGCVSADPEYYTLYPLPPATASGIYTQDAHVAVKVQRPGLAKLLDRPEMVETLKQSRIERDATHLWAEPLDSMAERVLALDLSERMPASSVITESGSMQADYTYRVEWELQQFGSDENGNAQLTAQVSVVRPGEDAQTETVRLHAPGGSSAVERMRILSMLLAELGTRIAAGIRERSAHQEIPAPGGPVSHDLMNIPQARLENVPPLP